MKELFENLHKYLLKESSLSRIHQFITEHDTAMISGWRSNPDDKSKCADSVSEVSVNEHGSLKKETNKKRNRNLKATLLSLGYGITPAKGNFIENYSDLENRVEVKEDSLFVVNTNDSESFFADIDNLGQKFCQDSVLMIPMGGKGAYLLGTNHTEYPGYGNEDLVGDFLGGHTGEFLSRVGGRPFVFKEDKDRYKLEVYEDHSRNARMAIRAIAKRVLEE